MPGLSPMRNASAKGLALKAACNNNLPTQTNDVMVNPENPDSNPAAARIISTEEWVKMGYDLTSNSRQPLFYKSFLGFIMGVCGMPSSKYSSPAL